MVGVLGFSLLRPGPERRPRLRHARRTGTSARAPASRPMRWRAGPSARSRASAMPSSIPLSPPPIPELGTASGFTFRLQDRGGAGPRGADRTRATSCWAWPARARCSRRCAPTAWKTRRNCRSTSTATRPMRWASASRRSTPPCRPRWARATSTTSRTAAACSAWWCRPMRRRACSRKTCSSSTPATPRASRCRCRPSRARAGSPARSRRCATTATRRCASRARRRRATARARRWPRWKSSRPSCPQGFGFEWTGQSREEKLAGAQAIILYGFSILAVFLCLAALYESWTIPLSVILVVPLGVLGVLLATWLRCVFERRVLPGGADHHHRPVGEERDPDHRVRQGPAGAGQGRDRVGAGGRPPAVPPDHHDLAGLRPGRAAAGASPPAPARPASAPSAPA